MKTYTLILLLFLTLTDTIAQKPRPRDMGIDIGIFRVGENNAITDVKGVSVGHTTLIRGDNIRTELNKFNGESK